MKKVYVKPVMESEAFVANEYVAACFKITCNGHRPSRSFIYKKTPTEAEDDDDFYVNEIGVWVYTGKELGELGLGEALVIGGHVVSIIDADNSNSSV